MFEENAIYILLPVLLATTGLAFVLTEYDIVHPFTIVSSVMTISVAVAMLGIPRWNLYVSIDAAIIITTAVLVFGAFSFWADGRSKTRDSLKTGSALCMDRYLIDNRHLLLLIGIILLFTCWQFNVVHDLAYSVSKKATYANMIALARRSVTSANFKYARWFSYGNVIVSAILYSSLFTALSNIIYNWRQIPLKRRLLQNSKYFLPAVLCIPSFILSTGREQFLELFCFVVVCSSIMYQKKNQFTIHSKMQMTRLSALLCALFLGCFCAAGYLRTGLGAERLFQHLVGYIGSPIPEFSYFLEHYSFIETQYIGSTTLSGIYSNLNSLGLLHYKPPLFLEFSYLHQDFGTNVYTMLRRYIADYGYTGMYLIMAIMSVFYTAFYNYARFYAKAFWVIIFYSALVTPLVLSMYDDRFLAFVLSTTTLYKLAAVYLVCRFCVTKTEPMQYSR